MFVDLVLVKQANSKKYLFQAPAFTHFEPGATLIVETRFGDTTAKYIDSMTVDADSATFNFCVKCCRGATLPLAKVKGVQVVDELRYPEEKQT